MSQLTPCNACRLVGMRRRAAARGATITTERQGLGSDTPGWYKVTASDEPEPIAWFAELTVECCC